jgi:hypothetical protein
MYVQLDLQVISKDPKKKKHPLILMNFGLHLEKNNNLN